MEWLAIVQRTHTLGLIILAFVFCVTDVLSKENVQIKMAEPPSTTHFQSYSSSAKKLTLRTDPAPLSGPTHFQHLNGECFVGKEKGYEYTVCPFQNVTQKEERSSWNSFHGVLGVWYEWIVENDTLAGMLFTMGERCGAQDREAKVMFNCSTNTKVHSMSEPSTCSYKIWLDTPLACLCGAMQVFHLLADDQLKAWNSVEAEYYKDEITFQGLSKQRRKILTMAGLLQPPKPSTEQPAVNSNVQPVAVSTASECEKEKERLEIRLSELQTKVDILVRDYPAIAKTVGFISRNQSVTDSTEQKNSTTLMPPVSIGTNSTLSKQHEHMNDTGVTS